MVSTWSNGATVAPDPSAHESRNPMVLTGLVIVAAAIFFGRLAIQHWRGQRRSIVECLGLQWDRRSATDLLVGFAITTLVMVAISYRRWGTRWAV
jgi:hypothetical protein